MQKGIGRRVIELVRTRPVRIFLFCHWLGSSLKNGLYKLIDPFIHYKWICCILAFLILSFLTYWTIPRTSKFAIPPFKSSRVCPIWISEDTITPLDNTKHFLVSAYMDQRFKGFDIRIISIFMRDSMPPLYCLFCCAGRLSSSWAVFSVHSDHFEFPYGTTDVRCSIPQNCNATHVTLVPQPDNVEASSLRWLPIRNKDTHGKQSALRFNFTVCISTLFGEYNNALQYAQTLEMYRLLGVERVVIYNNSCGPELSRLLHSYSREGFVEMVQWPIHKYLNPSHGWLFSKHGGELQYYGQLVTLNECIYRSMDRSRYVLLNDIDEIIMPYQHDDLKSLMDVVQPQHPNTGVFLIQMLVFPRQTFKESQNVSQEAWSKVPGFNILERVYWKDRDKNIYHGHKMIIQPRMVEVTSVHDVLWFSGSKFKLPLQLCHIIHSIVRDEGAPLEQMHLDTRLWDFKDKLIPRVTESLERAGLLT